ncbi:hypothetical protein A4A49_62095, partial [Nicotiana attenuata]
TEEVENEEEDYADSFQGDSEDEEDHASNSYTLNEEAVKVQEEQIHNSSTTLSSKRGLSPNAPVFVPSEQKQNAAVVVKDMSNAKDQHKAIIPGMSTSVSAPFAKYNLTPTNILQALVSHDMETLKTLDNPRNDQGALVAGYNHIETFGVDMSQGFYEEGEEEELLDASFANVAREGDL